MLNATASLRIAAAQIPVAERVHENVASIERAIAFAQAEGAAILLTPEGSLSGYRPDFDAAETCAALEQVTARARAGGLGLALGTCFAEADGRRYNQLRFYATDGRYLGFHAKVLTCAGLEQPHDGEARHFDSARLRMFDFEGIPVGGLICNDLWANPLCTPQADPHLSQQLARMGACVIFHAVNGARAGDAWSELAWQYHESNLRLRARAGRVWIVTIDNCHPARWPCSAPGGVVGPDGEWACRTDASGERFIAFTLPLAGRSIASAC